MRKLLIIAAAASLLAGCQTDGYQSTALSSSPKEVVEVTAVHNGRVTLGPFVRTAGDCSTIGRSRARILAQPQAGSVSVATTTGDIYFGESHPLAKCNHRSAIGTTIIYLAPRGFSGDDSFEFRVVFPNGEARSKLVNVHVL